MNIIISLKNILSKNLYKKFWTLFFLMLISIIFEILGIGAAFPIIKSILSQNYFSFDVFGYKVIYSTSGWLAIFILIYLIKNLYLYFFNYYSSKFIHEIQTTLASRLYIGYLSLPFFLIKNKNTSFFLRNILTEVNNLSYTTQSVLILLTELLVFLSILIFLFFIQPIITLIALVFYSIFGLLIYLFFKEKNYNWGKSRQESDQEKIKFVQESFEGISEIKIYSLENFFYRKFFTHLFNSSKMALLSSIISFLPKYIFEILTVIFVAILLIFMNYIKLQASEIVTILAILGISMFRILPSINKILVSSQAIKYNLPVIELIENELKKIKNIKKDSVKINNENEEVVFFKKNKIDFSKIVLENMTFKYHDQIILKNVNFEILKNQTVGLLGESGSGKSTLANIIAYLLFPTEGSVYVENDKGSRISLKNLQKKISYVPQNIFILEDNIKNNIILDNEFDQDLFNNVLKDVELLEYVNKLSNKYDTLIGERGNNISGGQKQRIGLARALYSKPQILILDEASNALDEKTEKSIFKTLHALSGKMTILIITHKESNLFFCDKILTLKNGKIL